MISIELWGKEQVGQRLSTALAHFPILSEWPRKKQLL
jgi:hypothetical protein